MEIGYVGLGKMGKNMVLRLLEKGHQVVAWNRSEEPRKEVAEAGARVVDSLNGLVGELKTPRVIWLMLPPGNVTQTAIDSLSELLDPGDTVIDGSNNIYKVASKHHKQFSENKINFLDVGVSGGPDGARNGACLMIGGDFDVFKSLDSLFKDIAAEEAYQFFPGYGAGHYVKMVHNGIEYGMMQAIAEGFNLMKESDYKLDLIDVAKIYSQGSVIESRLISWLHQAYEENGVELSTFGGTVGHLGEGQWTVDDAREKQIPLKVIEDSLQFRIDSEKNPSYTGQILQALRTAFGGKRTEKDKPYK